MVNHFPAGVVPIRADTLPNGEGMVKTVMVLGTSLTAANWRRCWI